MVKVVRTVLAIFFGLMIMAGTPSASFAQGQYDPEAPCGRDARGLPMQCVAPGGSENAESTCLTQARVEQCIGYHQVACQQKGQPLACTVYNIGINCYGGDPQLCSLYQQLLFANRACVLDNDPRACAFLRQTLGV